jgi:hypothetical protein
MISIAIYAPNIHFARYPKGSSSREPRVLERLRHCHAGGRVDHKQSLDQVLCLEANR